MDMGGMLRALNSFRVAAKIRAVFAADLPSIFRTARSLRLGKVYDLVVRPVRRDAYL